MASPDGPTALGERSFRATIWTLAAQSSVFVSQLLTMAVLGRLLDEAEMGLVALGYVFQNLTVLLVGAGLSRALVQKQRVSATDEGSALWTSLGWALALWTGWAVASRPLAAYFGDARLGPFIAASGALAVPAALWPLATARLERELRFREIGMAELCGFAVPQALVTTAAALLGAGIWAPFIGALAGRTLQACLSIAWSGFRATSAFSWDAVRTLARYGAWTTGASAAAFLTSSVDYLVAGRVLGAAALGWYAVAYQLATLPRSRLVAAVALVAFPALSRLQSEPARLGRAWVRMNTWVGFAAFPVLAAMFVLAEPLIVVVFGERWSNAVPALRILCPAGALLAIRATAGSAINALGRPGLGFLSNLGVLAAAVPILAWAAPHGIEALAWGMVAVAAIDFVPLQLWVSRRLRVSASTWAAALAKPAALAVLSAGVAGLLARPIDEAWLALLVGVASFGCVYVALVVTFAPALSQEVRGLIGGIVSRAPLPALQEAKRVLSEAAAEGADAAASSEYEGPHVVGEVAQALAERRR